MYERAAFSQARMEFHQVLLSSCLTIDSQGKPSNCDSSNQTSIAIARGIADRLKLETVSERAAGQTSGNQFEAACADFVRATFLRLRADSSRGCYG